MNCNPVRAIEFTRIGAKRLMVIRKVNFLTITPCHVSFKLFTIFWGKQLLIIHSNSYFHDDDHVQNGIYTAPFHSLLSFFLKILSIFSKVHWISLYVVPLHWKSKRVVEYRRSKPYVINLTDSTLARLSKDSRRINGLAVTIRLTVYALKNMLISQPIPLVCDFDDIAWLLHILIFKKWKLTAFDWFQGMSQFNSVTRTQMKNRNNH